MKNSVTTASLFKPPQLPKLIFYLSFVVPLLSAANFALLPLTLSDYHAYPLSDFELETLPHGDARMGLDRAAKMFSPPKVYHHAWPGRISRVSRKFRNAARGHGSGLCCCRGAHSVFAQVPLHLFQRPTEQKDSTIMRFPITLSSFNACATSWKPSSNTYARVKDLVAKGDITEVEVRHVI